MVRASCAQEHVSFVKRAQHPLHAKGQLTTFVMDAYARQNRIGQGTIHCQDERLSQSERVILHIHQPFCCTTEQSSMHCQCGRLLQGKPVISHIHPPIALHD